MMTRLLAGIGHLFWAQAYLKQGRGANGGGMLCWLGGSVLSTHLEGADVDLILDGDGVVVPGGGLEIVPDVPVQAARQGIRQAVDGLDGKDPPLLGGDAQTGTAGLVDDVFYRLGEIIRVQPEIGVKP
jgi:hypothetical protein